MQPMTFTVLQSFTMVYGKTGFRFTVLHPLLRGVKRKARTINNAPLIGDAKQNTPHPHAHGRNARNTGMQRIFSPLCFIAVFRLIQALKLNGLLDSPLCFS